MCDLLSFLRLRLWLFGLLHARFRVNNRVPATGSEDEVGVLFFELGEVLLGGPYPWRVGFEQQIDFLCSLATIRLARFVAERSPYFKCSLIGLWIQCPNHRNGDDVGHTEDVSGEKQSQQMNHAVQLR
jgi:hypothetical protein